MFNYTVGNVPPEVQRMFFEHIKNNATLNGLKRVTPMWSILINSIFNDRANANTIVKDGLLIESRKSNRFEITNTLNFAIKVEYKYCAKKDNQSVKGEGTRIVNSNENFFGSDPWDVVRVKYLAIAILNITEVSSIEQRFNITKSKEKGIKFVEIELSEDFENSHFVI